MASHFDIRPPAPARCRRGARCAAAVAFLVAPALIPSAAFAQDEAVGSPIPSSAAGALPPGAIPGGTVSVPEGPVRLGGFFGVPYDEGVTPAGTAGPARAYEILPSIGGQILATDNVFPGTSSRRRADVITSIEPELRVTADTVRLQGSARYAPSLRFYASGQDEARIDQRFDGNALITLVPNSLFLDLRANARVLPVSGGFAEEDNGAIDRRDRSQTLTFAATPFYLTRFGSYASSIVGYTYQYSRLGGASGVLDPITTSADTTNSTAFFQPQDFSSHTGFAAVRTGEIFGRLALEARVSSTTYEGTGVLDGAHRAIGAVEGRYAFSRAITAIAEVGYEDQEYGGTNPLTISEPIWAVGVRLEPNPDSAVTLRYRRRDGFTAPSAEVRLAIGANIRLTGIYSDRLGTVAQRQADLLATTAVDATGQPYDTQTGGPSRGFANESLLALQSGLFRNRVMSATISYSLPRDTFALSAGREERIPVSAVLGTTIFRQESTSIGLAWSRALSEPTTLISSIRYGRVTTGAPRGVSPGLASNIGSQDSNSYTFRVTLAHRFSPNLAGSVQYLLTNRETEFAGFGTSRRRSSDSLQNAIIVSFRQYL